MPLFTRILTIGQVLDCLDTTGLELSRTQQKQRYKQDLLEIRSGVRRMVFLKDFEQCWLTWDGQYRLTKAF